MGTQKHTAHRTQLGPQRDPLTNDPYTPSCFASQVSDTLTECRRQLTRVVAVLQEAAAAGAQMVAPLAEQEGLSALKLEDIIGKAVEQVVSCLACT